MDDLAQDIQNDDEEFLRGIWDKIQDEGSYGALFIDYGLEIAPQDHNRLSQLVRAFVDITQELDSLFANAGLVKD